MEIGSKVLNLCLHYDNHWIGFCAWIDCSGKSLSNLKYFIILNYVILETRYFV